MWLCSGSAVQWARTAFALGGVLVCIPNALVGNWILDRDPFVALFIGVFKVISKEILRLANILKGSSAGKKNLGSLNS